MRILFVFLAVAALAACTGKSVINGRPSREVAQASNVYLNTAEFPSEIQAQLIAGAEGKIKPTLQQAQALMAAYGASAEFAQIKNEYVNRLYTILKADPKKPVKWIKANAEFYKGIQNYAGDSGEDMSGDGPSWQTVNGALREGKGLDPVNQKFLEEILFSVGKLPTFAGLAFRGVRFTPERWKSLEVGKIWHQGGFTSTSIDPAVAAGFGPGSDGYARTGIMILKLKSGAPISPVTFDHGKMGQPGRFSEYEVLLEPGRNLMIRHKIEDSKTCIVFAEEV